MCKGDCGKGKRSRDRYDSRRSAVSIWHRSKRFRYPHSADLSGPARDAAGGGSICLLRKAGECGKITACVLIKTDLEGCPDKTKRLSEMARFFPAAFLYCKKNRWSNRSKCGTIHIGELFRKEHVICNSQPSLPLRFWATERKDLRKRCLRI